MRTSLIENYICICGHNDNNHKKDKEFTLDCQLCQCEEYDEEIE